MKLTTLINKCLDFDTDSTANKIKTQLAYIKFLNALKRTDLPEDDPARFLVKLVRQASAAKTGNCDLSTPQPNYWLFQGQFDDNFWAINFDPLRLNSGKIYYKVGSANFKNYDLIATDLNFNKDEKIAGQFFNRALALFLKTLDKNYGQTPETGFYTHGKYEQDKERKQKYRVFDQNDKALWTIEYFKNLNGWLRRERKKLSFTYIVNDKQLDDALTFGKKLMKSGAKTLH